ncbi:MAG: hypothetical protein K0R49_1258 [Burkholderiales bacterium]|jgi:hypothetical protein|nr:hypothetical protein [Burkholderiales bacterium]
MKKLTFLTAFLLTSAAIANAYNPSYLDAFNKTNICNGCDLS